MRAVDGLRWGVMSPFLYASFRVPKRLELCVIATFSLVPFPFVTYPLPISNVFLNRIWLF